MIAKQDRQGVRTAEDIEQKYNLGQDYSSVVKLATDAQAVAGRAYNAVIDLSRALQTAFVLVSNAFPRADESTYGKLLILQEEDEDRAYICVRHGSGYRWKEIALQIPDLTYLLDANQNVLKSADGMYLATM